METETRTDKIATTLERQLSHCDTVLAACLTTVDPTDPDREWAIRRMLGLMKTSTQLANVIARMEAKSPPENREKRGSIQQ